MIRHRLFLAVAGLAISGFTACGGGAASQPGNSTPPPPSTFQETSSDASGTRNHGLQPAIEFWADPDDAAGAGERRVQHHLNYRSLPVSGNHGDPAGAL